jgi:hypothetical protein
MTRMLTAALAAVGVALAAMRADARCSSLNGPFCAGLGVQFALETPLYASEDLSKELVRHS